MTTNKTLYNCNRHNTLQKKTMETRPFMSYEHLTKTFNIIQEEDEQVIKEKMKFSNQTGEWDSINIVFIKN